MNIKNRQITSIPEFFNGKSVFITGGTGFLGKVIVEKLLRSCPKIENIYLLIRSKKGKSVDERFDELTKSQIFNVLREMNPEAIKKIILIEGDVKKMELGMSKENYNLLCNKVSLIFNSAANVMFDEPLKEVINSNLISLNELIKLSRQMKDLKSFIHISTAYSNWYELDVKEKFYPTAFDPQYVMDLCNGYSNDKINEVSKKMLGKHVNTYTFSKALAEELIFRTAKDLPIAVVRPSTIGASLTEPQAGWVDSYTASTPYVDQISRGIFRSTHCDKNIIFDLIPVDIVSNLTIATSWHIAQNVNQKLAISTPKIFNCVSGNSNPLTIQNYLEYIRDAGRKFPTDMMSWCPQSRFYKTKFLSDLDNFITHFIPALLSDSMSKIKGQNEKAIKYLKKSNDAYDQVRFIMNNPIKVYGENYNKIQKSLCTSDQKDFNFDPRTINWKSYMENYHLGVRKFIFNDKSVGSVAAQKKFARLKSANYIITGSFVAFSLLAALQIGKEFTPKINNKIQSKPDDQVLILTQ